MQPFERTTRVQVGLARVTRCLRDVLVVCALGFGAGRSTVVQHPCHSVAVLSGAEVSP